MAPELQTDCFEALVTGIITHLHKGFAIYRFPDGKLEPAYILLKPEAGLQFHTLTPLSFKQEPDWKKSKRVHPLRSLRQVEKRHLRQRRFAAA